MGGEALRWRTAGISMMRLPFMIVGFLAAGVGDWLLAVRGCPRGTAGFLGGVAAFSAAQLLWMAAHSREARPDLRAFVSLAFPLSLFVGVRLWPVLSPMESVAVSVYAVIGSLNVAMAWATRRRFYFAGALLLLVSDVMIGGRWLGVPGASKLVGPLYLSAEASLLVSACRKGEPRRTDAGKSVAAVGLATVVLAGGAFVLAAVVFPGGGYDPCLRMLSALGRTQASGGAYPLSHSLFVIGMILATCGIVTIARCCDLPRWGTSLNAGGLFAIALVPEDVNMFFHNAGCWMAAIGGGVMLIGWFQSEPVRRVRWLWAGLLVSSLLGIASGLLSHAVGILPFAPWVPTAQKVVILSFAAWMLFLAVRNRDRRI